LPVRQRNRTRRTIGDAGRDGRREATRLRTTRCEQRQLRYNIKSRIPGKGELRFIEVKGPIGGADTVTITKNEILTGLNKPDDFSRANVEVDDDWGTPRYVRRPFQREPDFGVASVNYELRALLEPATMPS